MISVAGGVYAERCLEPFWDDVYGSAGRSAALISGEVEDVRLHTYRAEGLEDGLANLAAVYRLDVRGPKVSGPGVAFEYLHSLSDPRIVPRRDLIEEREPLEVEDDVVLRFGMMEGSAKVTARRAVYDPQSAFAPQPFHRNGSCAQELAIVLNGLEGRRLTGKSEPEDIIDTLFAEHGADIVILKQGGRGAIVATQTSRSPVPAYRSASVWKIGSGDVFSAAFTLHWAIHDRSPQDAADLASRSVSHYVSTRSLPLPSSGELRRTVDRPIGPGQGRIYIAGPFFNLGELWMIEEIRSQLLHMGVAVFSPLHDVGRGPAHKVAKADLAGLDACDVVLAVLNGGDAGTIFEVGYAVARGKPVVALAQNIRPEDMKMTIGSGCQVADDLVSAIYRAVWALP
ncbi:PfkB family carbohydrate kinase [Roseixanthobacter glucoisosaccharinicivorans]|uniref:PfkB family carbohydrate kinase n=1 Tax=Roseixanthobacter glucoisosaccharinicivorans TaxID=3119923 RepID=UPI003728E965